MISDTLSSAVIEMNEYLDSSCLYDEENFSPAEWAQIKACIQVMNSTRMMLDTPDRDLLSE